MAMRERKPNIIYLLSTRILLALLILFMVVAGVVGATNTRNIRALYEQSYTERLLLTNALMGTLIRGEDIRYFVDLLRNQDDDFKRRQVEFYHNREELFRLQRDGAPEQLQQVLLDQLASFHAETQGLKNAAYWDTLDALKRLKQVSRSTYVYVMADTGLQTRDGERLYTYVFDAEDEGEYSSPEMDGLGTCDIGNEAFENVFITKQQTGQAEHYEGDFGELYFVCVPILSDSGDVIGVLGTDLALDDMNNAIAASIALFNGIIFAVCILCGIVIFVLLNRTIVRPLGSLTRTARLFAEGNLHTSISESALKQRTEIGTLARAIKSTLNATTLYLDSIPEGLFIMNRSRQTLFRNEQFMKRFGMMQAGEFMRHVFPKDAADQIERQLSQENNTAIAWIDGSCLAVMLKEITLSDMPENSILVIANDITDLMNEKENAQAAAAAKSNFLSRMSHEMRTPMNAIIGMAKVAGDSDSLPNIRHCLSTINASSEQLLGIINDVLDMSKIEAGKLELENRPINIEKILMKVCRIVIDAAEKKEQKFNISLGEGLRLHYVADELRLSQVLTNLLSNAIKFTPEGGAISLTVESAGHQEEKAVLRFSVSDTGIGMTAEQVARMFNAFEQADGSIARKFGGTGLGLAISQSIIEKMGGRIEVESEPGVGTKFSFAVALENAPYQDAVICGGIRPQDIRLLIVESDDGVRSHFLGIVERFGIGADVAATAEAALALVNAAHRVGRAYDMIFLSHEMPGTDGISLVEQLNGRIDRSAVIIITSYLAWHRIEKHAQEHGITRCIAKPIFPSSVLNIINDIVGKSLKSLDTKPPGEDAVPDLSGVRVLLAEDIEINREIFLALMEGTGIATDIAENGLEAVAKFKEAPELYDIIIMDIQMPEMDGYEATRAIRALEHPRAKAIPIVAMSANAFKEDIDRCRECGMNDHLAKPIDIKAVYEKIARYSTDRG